MRTAPVILSFSSFLFAGTDWRPPLVVASLPLSRCAPPSLARAHRVLPFHVPFGGGGAPFLPDEPLFAAGTAGRRLLSSSSSSSSSSELWKWLEVLARHVTTQATRCGAHGGAARRHALAHRACAALAVRCVPSSHSRPGGPHSSRSVLLASLALAPSHTRATSVRCTTNLFHSTAKFTPAHARSRCCSWGATLLEPRPAPVMHHEAGLARGANDII